MSFEIKRDSVADSYGKKRSRFRVEVPPDSDPSLLPTRINLRRAREGTGLTRQNLANELLLRDPDVSISIQDLDRIEQGRKRITPEMVRAVAEITGTIPQELRGNDYNELSTQKLRRRT